MYNTTDWIRSGVPLGRSLSDGEKKVHTIARAGPTFVIGLCLQLGLHLVRTLGKKNVP